MCPVDACSALVAEVMLFSEGFEDSKVLSRKMVQLYKLASEQLSQQVGRPRMWAGSHGAAVLGCTQLVPLHLLRCAARPLAGL